jgi:malate/lactate dehydrogenase
VIVASYEEAIQKSPSAKILIFTNDVDQLMEVAEKELPKDTFHMIRGSPFPFFVEFLLPGINV